MSGVRVDVEYCTPCGFAKQFEALANELKAADPNIDVRGHEGLPGAFEVTVNGKLVHSRLKLLSFPDFGDLTRIVMKVADGAAVPTTVKQQPINDCHVS